MYCPLCKREVQPQSPVTPAMWVIAIVVVGLVFVVAGLFFAIIVAGGALLSTNFMKRKCPICGSTDLQSLSGPSAAAAAQSDNPPHPE